MKKNIYMYIHISFQDMQETFHNNSTNTFTNTFANTATNTDSK